MSSALVALRLHDCLAHLGNKQTNKQDEKVRRTTPPCVCLCAIIISHTHNLHHQTTSSDDVYRKTCIRHVVFLTHTHTHTQDGIINDPSLAGFATWKNLAHEDDDDDAALGPILLRFSNGHPLLPPKKLARPGPSCSRRVVQRGR